MIESLDKNSQAIMGFGLGLRPVHYDAILQQSPKLDWFEILTENYINLGAQSMHYLDRIRQQYPMVMHGVSLSLGGTDPLDLNYLKRVKELASRIEPAWISDHLCWIGVNGINTHDLLPLPYTEDAIQQVVSRIDQVQDFFGRQLLIENVSSYLTYQQSEMTEWEFFAEIVKRADCYILLDVNNIYVSASNHGFACQDYLQGIPGDRVRQIHLAGHAKQGDYLIDTHDAPIVEPVWDLYAEVVRRFGVIPTMIERDDNIPELRELMRELEQARSIAYAVSARVAV